MGTDLIQPPRTGLPSRLVAFSEAATLALVAAIAVAVPLVFSVAVRDAFAGPKSLVAWAIALVVAGQLGVRWLARGLPGRQPATALGWALVGWLAWNLVAFGQSIDRAQSTWGESLQYQGLVAVLAYLAAFAGAGLARGRPGARRAILAAVVVGSVPVVAYALIQRAGLDPIWPALPKDRVFSTIGQANNLAAYLVLAACAAVALATEGGRTLRLGRAILLGVLLAGILASLAFTLSRGGYLGAVVAAGVLLAAAAWRLRGRLLRPLVAGGVAVAVVLGVAVVALPTLRAQLGRTVDRALSTADLAEGSIASHLDLWAVGVAIAADHPLVGTGQDTYVLVFPDYRDRILAPDRAAIMARFRPESPHNVYLAIAAGAGFPALAAYLAVIAAVAWRLVAVLRAGGATSPSDRPVAAALLAAIAGHLVTDAFMTAEVTGSILFWLLLGLAAALRPPPVRAA